MGCKGWYIVAAPNETDDGKTVWIERSEPNRPLSRYNGLRAYINSDGYPVLETFHMEEIAVLPGDRYFYVTLPFVSRPDLIALLFYGTAQLYWVIAFANVMIDPFAQTKVGMTLRIPDDDNIRQTVLDLN